MGQVTYHVTRLSGWKQQVYIPHQQQLQQGGKLVVDFLRMEFRVRRTQDNETSQNHRMLLKSCWLEDQI